MSSGDSALAAAIERRLANEQPRVAGIPLKCQLKARYLLKALCAKCTLFRSIGLLRANASHCQEVLLAEIVNTD